MATLGTGVGELFTAVPAAMCARTRAAAVGLFDASSSRARYSINVASARASGLTRAASINSSVALGSCPCCAKSSARRIEASTSLSSV